MGTQPDGSFFVSYDDWLAEAADMTFMPEGKSATGTPGGVTHIDFEWPEEREIKGADVDAWQGVFGDSVAVSVVVGSAGLPAGALYPGSPALPPGYLLRPIASTVPLPPTKHVQVQVDYSVTLLPGLAFRVSYTSVGTDPPQVGVLVIAWAPAQLVL